MRAIILASAVLIGSSCGVSAQAPPLAMPSWMSGYWLSCEDGRETAENWIGAGRDVMLGANLSGEGFEFLRIAADARGGLSYFSMPNGSSPPTPFVMTSNADQRVVFENPQHDFPQRVTYERDGDVMVARIEGTMNGREDSVQWRFDRAVADARCPS